MPAITLNSTADSAGKLAKQFSALSMFTELKMANGSPNGENILTEQLG